MCYKYISIQCVLCHEDCADTNALVEHIRNKHYYQVAGQLSAPNHTEALQEKKPASNDAIPLLMSMPLLTTMDAK
jgi:hypothetical protein